MLSHSGQYEKKVPMQSDAMPYRRASVSLFSWVYLKTPFTKEGAVKLLSALGVEYSEELLNQCFVSKAGRSYYMTEYFLDNNRELGMRSGLANALDNMLFEHMITITDREGFVLQDPELMKKLAELLDCRLEQLAYKMPEKRLNPTAIESVNSFTVAELGLSESNVMFCSLDGADNQSVFNEALHQIIKGRARYIFCHKGCHANLISFRRIDGIRYFFIIDSLGFAFEDRIIIEKNEVEREELIPNRKLIRMQIEILTSLNEFIVVSTEQRQRDFSSCPMFAREDLRVLHQFDYLHQEMLNQSISTRDNLYLYTCPKFPAQMLLLWQVPTETLLADPRSQKTVMDRDGESGKLGEILVKKHYDPARGLNKYSTKLMDEFIKGVNREVPKLVCPPTLMATSSMHLSFAIDARLVIGMSDFLIWQKGLETTCNTMQCTYSERVLEDAVTFGERVNQSSRDVWMRSV